MVLLLLWSRRQRLPRWLSAGLAAMAWRRWAHLLLLLGLAEVC